MDDGCRIQTMVVEVQCGHGETQSPYSVVHGQLQRPQDPLPVKQWLPFSRLPPPAHFSPSLLEKTARNGGGTAMIEPLGGTAEQQTHAAPVRAATATVKADTQAAEDTEHERAWQVDQSLVGDGPPRAARERGRGKVSGGTGEAEPRGLADESG